MVYPENSREERAAWMAKKCADCPAGGAYLYCNKCQRELCTECRNRHRMANYCMVASNGTD